MCSNTRVLSAVLFSQLSTTNLHFLTFPNHPFLHQILASWIQNKGKSCLLLLKIYAPQSAEVPGAEPRGTHMLKNGYLWNEDLKERRKQSPDSSSHDDANVSLVGNVPKEGSLFPRMWRTIKTA